MPHPQQQDVYVDDPRAEIARHLPAGARSALDVGCARGGFGLSLRERLGDGAEIVGIEPVASTAAVAREGHGFDRVLEGYFPDLLEGAEDRFDLICFNDVLEHIVDPWEVLRACHRHLTPDGCVLAAIPNVQWLPNVIRLLQGRWDYTDTGILDRTHVRFFTRSSTIQLFRSAGFSVVSCQGENRFADSGNHHNRLGSLIRRCVDPFVGNSRYLHFVVVAEPVPDHESGAT